ncbi:hypothetical protein ABTB02_19845, partial [Acinetobacter baumannii]
GKPAIRVPAEAVHADATGRRGEGNHDGELGGCRRNCLRFSQVRGEIPMQLRLKPGRISR